MDNLWPQFKKKDELSPKAIIAEQAEHFNKLGTGLRAYLNTTQGTPEDVFELGEPEHLLHTLRINASSIDGFTFTLLRASHKTIAIYPVKIYSALENKKYSASTAEELQKCLQSIFQAKETVEAIQNLMSQIK